MSGEPGAGRTPGKPRATPIVIGWREYVALPEWGIERVLAKSDTGAATGALDVGHLEDLDDGRVAFDVVTSRRREDAVIHVVADVIRRTRVRSSFGQRHDRVLVETTMRLGPIEKTIQLGLVDRRRMHCRMLLGRRALSPDFLVDSAHAYIFGRRKPKPRVKPADRAG